MKDTGIYRAVDEFGRFVIPKELRRLIEVQDDKDSLDLYIKDDMIYCVKHQSRKSDLAISRKIDRLGRIVVPKGILKTLNFDIETDRFHIYTDGNKVILVRQPFGCVFCGSVENPVMFSDRYICKDCLNKLKNI